MKIIVSFVLVAGMLSGGLFAQSTYQRKALCTVRNAAVAGSVFSFEIWARNDSTGTTFFVGNSDFYFSYNSAALNTPTLSNINPKYTGIAGVDNYDPMQVGIIGGNLQVGIRFSGAAGGSSLLVTTAPYGELICQVNLNITNASQTAQLHWDTTNTGVLTTGTFAVFRTLNGSDNGPLPVQLASFTAMRFNTSGVRLNWRTVSEVNNYGFYVQRRNVGVLEWMELPNSFVAGHGTTSDPHDYLFTNNDAPTGSLQYRLKQVDLDATVHYSEPVQASGMTSVDGKELAPIEFALKQNYPNPFNPSTEIKFSVAATDRATLDVYNVLGQKVATLFDDVAEPGQYYRVRFDGGNLASGIYFYWLQSGKKSDLKKFMLIK